MEYRLTRARADVHHRTIPILNVSFSRDLRRRQMTSSHCLNIFQSSFLQSTNVLLRDHQNVGWTLGINVLESEGVLVLEHLLGRNFAADDTAEQTIFHR